MGTQHYLDALAAERHHNANQRKTIYVIAAVAMVGFYTAWSHPKQIDLHISPDLKAGETVQIRHGVAPVPQPNLYSFAYYVWQQVNRWQADGSKDYGKQIYDFQQYLTPRCQAQLQADLENRSRAGELHQRTRQISEIPGFGFQESRVKNDGSSAWTVLLDMQVMETFRGQSIKDTFVRYPVRVVRFDVDRQRNPFQLALDCFGDNRPARIDPRDVEQRTKPAAGGTISPATLPRVLDTNTEAPDAGAPR
jgi:integrating conjugative element protein (TIGR03746 family)